MDKLWQKVVDKRKNGSSKITFQKSPASSVQNSREFPAPVPGAKIAARDSEAARATSEAAMNDLAAELEAVANAKLGKNVLVRMNSLRMENRNSLIQTSTISSVDEIPDIKSEFHSFLRANKRYEKLVMPFDDLRVTKYQHLDEENRAVFDYIGTGLFSYTQLIDSEHPLPTLPLFVRGRSVNLNFHDIDQRNSLNTGTLEYELREKVFDLFQTYEDEYELFFTANGGAAIQLLGDSFSFDSRSLLLTAYDCADPYIDHVRRIAARGGAQMAKVPITWPDLKINFAELKKLLAALSAPSAPSTPTSHSKDPSSSSPRRGLVIAPVESLVSGSRLLTSDWSRVVGEAQSRGWKFLLDARGLSPGEALHLQQQYRPDFVAYSFFKIFGHDPTGFGCLLVRKPPPPQPHSPYGPTGSLHSATSPSPSPTTPHRSNSLSLARLLHRRMPSDDSQHSGSTSGQSRAATSSSATFPDFLEGYVPISPSGDQSGAAYSPIPSNGSVSGEVSRNLVPMKGAAEEEEGGEEEEEEEERRRGGGDWERDRERLSRASSFSSTGQRALAEGELTCEGLEHLGLMGAAAVSLHLECLTEWLMVSLRRLKHPGMEKRGLVEIYGPLNVKDRGSKLAFNIVDYKWEIVSPTLVQVLADRQDISVFVGQLWQTENVGSAIPSHKKSMKPPAKANSGSRPKPRPVDCVAISLGLVSNFEDVYRLWAFVAQFLDPEFTYRESIEYQLMNQQVVKIS